MIKDICSILFIERYFYWDISILPLPPNAKQPAILLLEAADVLYYIDMIQIFYIFQKF